MQSLVATLTGSHVPFLGTETHELGEERVASYLYQVTSAVGWNGTTTGDFWPTTTSNKPRPSIYSQHCT